jgi:hypothetical protein
MTRREIINKLAKLFPKTFFVGLFDLAQRENFDALVGGEPRDDRVEAVIVVHGTGGTLTGRGGDVSIIDHPMKPQDAQSKSTRDKTIQWYENTLVSRPDDKVKGAIVLVMQRLHLEDLAGHLLEKRGFEHLCLRAIAEADETIQLDYGGVYHRKTGEVLDPSREPPAALEKLRSEMTPLVFSAQYQQRPIPLAGNIMKSDWIRDYRGNIP